MNTLSISSLAVILLTSSLAAHAEQKIEQTFDVTAKQALAINVPVGSLELSTHQRVTK